MKMSEEGLVKLTEPWEEFVAYPYDDKRGKVRNAEGKLAYREWTGGKVYGTITIGFGHTNAAGPIRQLGKRLIEPGMRLTEEQARELLLDDMAPVERLVDKHLKVQVTQHQYDCLADMTFNCPSALPHVASLVNANKWSSVSKVMFEYIYSKGERMQGLVRRRAAEIAWAHTPDDPEDLATEATPRAEAKPKTPIATKAIVTGGTVLTAGAGVVPLDMLHTNWFATLLGASTAGLAGLIWNHKWRT